MELANTVDSVIAERLEAAATDEHIQTYVKNVERAASDLGSRKARETALDIKLAPVFPPMN
jgi:hypothetical protein